MPKGREITRRLPAPARRQLILEAARAAIVAKGLGAVSVREIAREANISSGTVTHHFPSIDELLSAVLRAEATRFHELRSRLLAQRRSALEGLFALGDWLFVDRREVHEYWALWLDHWARAAHDPSLASWQSEDYAAWRELVASLVTEGVEQGEFRPVDAVAVATELTALIDGLGLQAFFQVAGLSPDEARARFRAAVQERLRPTDQASNPA